jgi:glycosyltransferase involved in cell wall biosynthesis
MPRVSVVIPTYNRADLIGETLQSVVEQTFTDWECSVVDDGSTDNTREVVEAFIAGDPRFLYVWQANASATVARNHGLALARGEYVAFVDSDDHFAPDRLAWQVAALDRNPEAVLVYGNTLHCRSSDMRHGEIYLADLVQKPSGWAFEQLLQCSAIYAPLVRTDVIRRLNGFDTTLPQAGEDWDMWLRLSRVGTIIFDPRIHLYYRVHEGNISRDSLHLYRGARRVLTRHLRDLPLRTRLRLHMAARRYLQKGYTPRFLAEAADLNERGDWPAARQVWRALVALNPRLLLQPRVLLNALWALLPTRAEPPWRALRRRFSAHVA